MHISIFHYSNNTFRLCRNLSYHPFYNTLWFIFKFEWAVRLRSYIYLHVRSKKVSESTNAWICMPYLFSLFGINWQKLHLPLSSSCISSIVQFSPTVYTAWQRCTNPSNIIRMAASLSFIFLSVLVFISSNLSARSNRLNRFRGMTAISKLMSAAHTHLLTD